MLTKKTKQFKTKETNTSIIKQKETNVLRVTKIKMIGLRVLAFIISLF